MRQIASEEELEELHTAASGLIYNDFSGLGATGAQYNVLHASDCRWLSRSNTNVRKLYFENLAETIEWLEANRGPEGRSWKRCGSCRATRATTKRTVAEPRRASVKPTPRTSSSTPHVDWDVMRASRDHPCVEAWSTVRLPLTPRGEMKEFQHALRTAIAELRADEGELLTALYASESHELVDAENVLFYNLGSSSAFAHSTRGGLRFERSYAPPPPARLTDAAYYHRYSIADETDGFAIWRVGDSPVAQFQAEPALLGSLDSARIWYALKRGIVDLHRPAEIAADFALRVKVVLPQPRNADVLAKPIFDGAIAALQSQDHRQSSPDEFARLAERIGMSTPEVASLLKERHSAVLGTARLLRPGNKTVQLNPSDDRCVAAELIVTSGTTWALTGEVYEVAARATSSDRSTLRPAPDSGAS